MAGKRGEKKQNLSISALLVRHTSRAKESAVQEGDIARQHTTSQSFKSFGSIGGAALTGLGLLLLFGTVDLGAAQLSHLLCATAWEALGVLPSVVLSSWQALQPYAFEHQQFSPCPLQMLALSWPLLHVIAGAA